MKRTQEINMSNDTLRIILALVVGAHGIGHILFLVPSLGIADWGQSTQSWLLTNALGDTLTRLIGAAIWLLGTLGFGVATFGIFTQTEWWRSLTVASSIVSIVGLALFWANPAASSAFFAFAFDAAVLVALLVFHWPSTTVVGA
jgi:hypothetical protein